MYHYTRRENKNPVAKIPWKVTLSGMTEDLKGDIYNLGTGSKANQFTATTKALASYDGQKCNNPQDIRISIKQQKCMIIPIPSMIRDIDKDVSKLLLGKEIDTNVKRAQ